MHAKVYFFNGLLACCLLLIRCARGEDILLACDDNRSLRELGENDRFIIRSHDFSLSGGYDASQRCDYRVRKTNQCNRMFIQCPLFELEDSENCRKDSLKITGDDFDFSVNPLHPNGMLCGEINDITIFSASPRVRFRFKTNRRNNDFKGFECFVSCADNLVSSILPTPSTTPIPETCKCGQPNRLTRIQGGEDAEINEYPWQTLIQIITSESNAFFCGGTLISDHHVITSASCFLTATTNLANNPETILIVLGLHDLRNLSLTKNVFSRISSLKLHPEYNKISLDNDFALVTLELPIDFDTYPKIRPACLPLRGHELPLGSDVVVTGWGVTGGAPKSVLQEATVSTMASTVCEAKIQAQITSNMLCAEPLTRGQGPCSGDQGAPLVSSYSSQGFYEIVGVASFGPGCTNPDAPFVYSNVTAALQWITSEIGQPSCERPSNIT